MLWYLVLKYFLNKWTNEVEVMKGKLSCQRFDLIVIIILILSPLPPGIPLFETQPTYTPLYELITQFELSKDPDPIPLKHNMRFYAVSKTLWAVVGYVWTPNENLPL